MTLKDFIEVLQRITIENPDADGLPVIFSDSQYAEREVTSAGIEVPYTGIGRWVVIG